MKVKELIKLLQAEWDQEKEVYIQLKQNDNPSGMFGRGGGNSGEVATVKKIETCCTRGKGGDERWVNGWEGKKRLALRG